MIIKPDAVQRGLIGEIILKFEAKGFRCVAMNFTKPPREMFELLWIEHKDRDFYTSCVDYACMGPVLVMVMEGDEIVATGRKIMGNVKPENSKIARFIEI